MTIRDDLAVTIADVINAWTIGHPDGLGRDDLGERVADAMLVWLGDIDPSCDAELIRWHLVQSKTYIEELRAERDMALAADGAHRARAEELERVLAAARVLELACATGVDTDVHIALCSLLSVLSTAQVPV